MSRTRTDAYCGATGSAKISTLEDALALGSNWRVSVKADGAYAQVHVSRQGLIDRVLSRSAQPLAQNVIGDLLGCHVGPPGAVSIYVGEIEAYTERGNAAATARGWHNIDLWDALVVAGRDVTREPYRVRRDLLQRALAYAENFGPDLGHVPTFERITGRRGRDLESGRFCTATPRDARRTPVLDLYPLSQAPALWERAVAGEIEGLVFTEVERAKAGARGSRYKLKPTRTADMTVLRAEKGGLLCYYAPGDRLVALGPRKGVNAKAGDVVEAVYEGAEGELRFCRLSSRGVREDLRPIVPMRWAV